VGLLKNRYFFHAYSSSAYFETPVEARTRTDKIDPPKFFFEKFLEKFFFFVFFWNDLKSFTKVFLASFS